MRHTHTRIRAGEVRFRLAGHFALLIPLLLLGGAGCGVSEPQALETTTRALAGGDIDRVLGFETPIADWSVLWSASGTITSSDVAAAGAHSLALQPRNHVPIESVQMSSLGTRAGTSLQFDLRFEGVQPDPYWWGSVQAGISIPSLGVDAGSNGTLPPSFELTNHLATGWNTLTL